MDLEGVYQRLVSGARLPLATYRVQLSRELTFEDAGELVDYLYALGVSDLYASPFFKARPGSMHGYDLVDHNALSPEIGSRDALRALSSRLAQRGMGLLLDFVPNHMGIGTSENGWWMDVLENGPSSLYAPFFDVDWTPLKSELESKVLLPVLGDHYGSVLEGGDLRVEYDAGAFFVRCYTTLLPVNPRTYPMILAGMLPELVAALGDEHDAVLELQSILTGLAHLPPRTVTARPKVIERRREKEVLKRRLAALVADSPAIAEALPARLRVINGERGDPRSFDALDALLEQQAYRLSYFRVAAEEINYRRFFDINDLAAIRMENPAVFTEAHRLLFALLAEGTVTGLRVDHPDGLWDPVSYFARLQRAVFLERAEREVRTGVAWGAEEAEALAVLMSRFDREACEPGAPPPRPLYIVVEKILSRGEELPRDWAVHGTSGYDFATLAAGLFVDSSAERAMTSLYERFTGLQVDFGTLMYEKKKLVLETSLASELNVLAHALNRLSERDRHSRDFTLGTLTAALREVIACFPVYRTYVREDTVTVAPRDRAAIGVALRLVRRHNPTTDASVYAFLRAILLLEVPLTVPEGDSRSYREFVMKLQQLTGPVMAKGLEDTAFYIYNRLASLNEVGGEPERFGTRVSELHQVNAERLRGSPYSMLATSTHDTKRSEDVRARISVLSELPREWEVELDRAAAAAAPFRTDLDERRTPDANEEYLFYQTVLGTFPSGAKEAPPDYVERLVAYMRKAAREAKVNTSWLNADPAYDAAVEAFVRGALGSADVLGALETLALTVAHHGRWAALSQTLLKLTSPGVPDIYQGNELWDDSLVDPDNRRKVDWRKRRTMLDEILTRKAEGEPFARELVTTAADGRIKLFVTHVALHARRRTPRLFGAEGAYVPLDATGSLRDHVIAFARTAPGERAILTVVPRLTAKLVAGRLHPPTAPLWGDTVIAAPPGRYENLFTRAHLTATEGGLRLDDVLACFPVGLFQETD